MLTLIHFIIGSPDGDYGALTFEQSGISLFQVYDAMEEGSSSLDASALGGEEGEWEVSIANIMEVPSVELADQIIDLIDNVAGENGVGDYDMLKHRSYGYILLDEESNLLIKQSHTGDESSYDDEDLENRDYDEEE